VRRHEAEPLSALAFKIATDQHLASSRSCALLRRAGERLAGPERHKDRKERIG